MGSALVVAACARWVSSGGCLRSVLLGLTLSLAAPGDTSAPTAGMLSSSLSHPERRRERQSSARESGGGWKSACMLASQLDGPAHRAPRHAQDLVVVLQARGASVSPSLRERHCTALLVSPRPARDAPAPRASRRVHALAAGPHAQAPGVPEAPHVGLGAVRSNSSLAAGLFLGEESPTWLSAAILKRGTN